MAISRMRLLLPASLFFWTVQAQYLIESSSFGHGSSISPNRFAVPGWHISGEDHVPQLLSDKVILTPPHPGSKRGAIWADTRVSQPEWNANFEFRATGPERGGGNLQIWYTKEGQDYVGTSSIYTVGRFDGLVLVVDQYGGRGGSIRGFLNDGSTDYKNHHAVDSQAFGHCNYAYRNLGRPSKINLKQEHGSFEVRVDDKPCFSSNKIQLPTNYYFGISAASAENPDSFEVYKFVLSTATTITREEPRRFDPPPQQQEQPQIQQMQSPPTQNQNPPQQQSPATSPGDNTQFVYIQGRLSSLTLALETITRDLSAFSSKAEERHQEALRKTVTTEQINALDQKLSSIDNKLSGIKSELDARQDQFAKLQDSLRESHHSLLEGLPHSVGDVIAKGSPRVGFFVFIVIVFQLLLAGSYVIYKRRRANAPKKYL